MALISLKEWAEAHGITQHTASQHAAAGRIPAQKIGRNYVIDSDAPKPEDGRIEHCKSLHKKKTAKCK